MNELSRLLQRKYSVVAVLAISSVIGLFWMVGDGVVRYASIYYGQSQVLGERASSQFRCIAQDQITKYLTDAKKSITVYSPDRSETLSLNALASCFTSYGCDEEGFSCEGGQVNLVQTCAQAYFQKNPLGAETVEVVSGAGASVQVKTHDWSVNYENLAAQLDDAVTKEVSYCQLLGVGESTRQNIGTIQVVVADEQPSVVDTNFAEVFLEIDASKEKVYLWNKGVYQTFTMVQGARAPSEAIYLRKNVDLSKLVGSADLEYMVKQLSDSSFVVVHR